ncbi:unnamed protein product [Enterobius vermicularis]|uniref:mitogen-activated protein kinase kinase n=1 Tax=Enterobius vermicularis TaxID=51028 RepID=A0A0N4UXI7_ENTVE|nr:unnamed protein product [Enterobius vermicularis]
MYNCATDEVILGDQIGQGNFGLVNVAYLKSAGRKMAVKIRRLTGDEEEDYHTFMDIEVPLRSIHCPYIVNFYGYHIFEAEARLFMELMVTSIDKLLQQDIDFPEAVISTVSKSVLHGLEYLNQLKITYRDVKPSNILVNEVGEVKICDFGIAGTFEDSNCICTFNPKYTFNIFQPERVRGDCSYSTKADVWSLGITLVEIANKCNPYQGNWCTVCYEILYADPPRLDSRIFSSNFCNFVNQCLCKRVEDRPSFAALLVTVYSVNLELASV